MMGDLAWMHTFLKESPISAALRPTTLQAYINSGFDKTLTPLSNPSK